LLGSGDSGKTTLLKQVAILDKGFTPDQKKEFKERILEQVYYN
jgi:ABC-type lipoprotein export system ATPase subunit